MKFQIQGEMMLKKTALVLSLSCAVALANENGFFAGASVGYSLGTISDERMLFGGLVRKISRLNKKYFRKYSRFYSRERQKTKLIYKKMEKI